MKIIVRALCLVLVAWLPAAQAANLTGTSSIVYQNAHYVFRNFNNATGYVRLNNGFTILAGQSAALDTFITVSGAIDLRTTGSLDLRSDVYLASAITFSTGGYINGRTNTIHLGDDVTLPTDSVFQFVSNTVIDGNNQNGLIFQPHAQILLETNVSLTLKNMTIRTTRNAPAIPFVRCFDQKGHVTLDNVVLELADNFTFDTGRLFFRNDVRVTGTGDFIYQSVMQSYVLSRSLLTFDPGTTLYYYPNSTSKDLIQLQDKSSVLFLKGSGTSLQTTHTGMRLTKGRLWLDNKVTLSTRSNTVLDSVSLTTQANYGSTAYGVTWSPNQRFLAVVGTTPNNSNELQIYKFDGSTLSLVASVDLVTSGNIIFTVAWSPDGRYLAIGGQTPGFWLYSFDGVSVLTKISSISMITTGNGVLSVAWSPDGRFIALGMTQPTASNHIQIYRFNRNGPPTSVTGINLGASTLAAYSVSWHPSGSPLAVGTGLGGTGGNETRLYTFNGSTLTLLSSIDYGGATSAAISVAFSPSGNFLAVAGQSPTNSNELHVYSFFGRSLILITSYDYTAAGNPLNSGSWDPSGRFLAIGGSTPANNNELQLLRFDNVALTLLTSKDYGTLALQGVTWSPDGNYVAVGGSASAGGGHNDIEVYSVAYRFDTSNQALSNGIVLGNSVAGATFDLDTTIFGGSRVELYGRLLYDPFS